MKSRRLMGEKIKGISRRTIFKPNGQETKGWVFESKKWISRELTADELKRAVIVSSPRPQ